MDVLVVMDMQKGLFSVTRHNAEKVVDHINRLGHIIRKNGGCVIHVQHNGLAEDGLQRGMDGWQILESIEVSLADLVIEKSTCDAFYGTDLDTELRKLSPQKVIFTGCCTDFCVDTTVRAAVSRDYQVVVPADAHTTADRPFLDGASVIKHHNWIWENLTTPGAPVQVISSTDLMTKLTR